MLFDLGKLDFLPREGFFPPERFGRPPAPEEVRERYALYFALVEDTDKIFKEARTHARAMIESGEAAFFMRKSGRLQKDAVEGRAMIESGEAAFFMRKSG